MKFVAKSWPGIAGAALLAVIAISGTGVGIGAGAHADQACAGGKVKYYRNPMGTPDTSPVPKKDSMNMDYIAVCEDETGDGPGTVKISLDKVQLLGVRSEEVQERALSRSIRAFATVQYDERRQYVVAPKFSGWIEKLAVNATGDAVTVGQELFDAYSPELNVLQQQWRVAGRSADATDKLRYLAYPEAALQKLRRGDPPSRTVSIPSPVAGTVVDKIAIEGMHFQPGDVLFRIVDTTNMWVLAEVYEQDLAFVKIGDTARVTVNAWPGRPFEGKVTFIYPGLGKESRTARLRIEVANSDGRLRADMTATVEITTPLDGSRLAVPESAVIDSGRRQVVLVERGQGRYEPRPVKLGARVPGWVQVLDGLRPGERVVTQATFLIDAESNIRAALAAFGHDQNKGETK
ncbi:MAG: efflux RND transporter periplasmic adaptor subunit [Reyranella sp.]|nr:efflux RND transporter periplasmic adaptor subunit [Reyranella sp.]